MNRVSNRGLHGNILPSHVHQSIGEQRRFSRAVALVMTIIRFAMKSNSRNRIAQFC
jgi:hypothetical protein